MTWFALTPVIGGEMLKSELLWAVSTDLGTGRAVGRLDERFEAKGHAYKSLGMTFRVDEVGETLSGELKLTDDTLLGTAAPHVGPGGQVTVAWSEA